MLAVGLLAVALGAAESLADRRQRVARMTTEQREELFHNEQMFRSLPPEEQQRIRSLHERIESAEDRDSLRATMNHYCKWFEAQPPYLRAKLAKLMRPDGGKLAPSGELKPADLQRLIHEIKRLLESQRKVAGKDIRLDDRNRQSLVRWMERYAADNEAKLIEAFSAGSHSGALTRLQPGMQRRAVREMLYRRWQSGKPAVLPPISEAEMARLRAGLTEDLRRSLDARPAAEQPGLIAAWLREAASAELDERLADFFENTLGDEDRDRLMGLPPDDMYGELCRLYDANMVKQGKPSEPRRPEPPRKGDRIWPRGRSPGPGWSPAGRPGLETRDGKDPKAARPSGESNSGDSR